MLDNGAMTPNPELIQQKVHDFQALSPEDFFEKYDNQGVGFVLALPKQKAIKRVMKDVMKHLEGKIEIKRANKRSGSTYAIDTTTGVVFGVTELKPGGLANAFGMKASKDAPKGTSYIKKDIEQSPAPVIGIVGKDTLAGIRAASPEIMGDVTYKTTLRTSHAGLYLGARDKTHLEKVGKDNMTIAVTDRYEPILRQHLEGKKARSDNPAAFVMPELIACDGGTEDYLNRYEGIDVICDIVDSGTSVLEAEIEHIQLLNRSKAVVVQHSSLEQHFGDRVTMIDNVVSMLQEAACKNFKATHDRTADLPDQDTIMTIDEFFDVMELVIEKAEKKLSKGDDEVFYDVKELATPPSLEAA